jgi:hypothetical protein
MRKYVARHVVLEDRIIVLYLGREMVMSHSSPLSKQNAHEVSNNGFFVCDMVTHVMASHILPLWLRYTAHIPSLQSCSSTYPLHNHLLNHPLTPIFFSSTTPIPNSSTCFAIN